MGLASSLNRTRLIGSEFEGYIILTGGNDPRAAQQSLADALTANGIRAIARGYDHSPLPPGVIVAVEYDSSISPEQRYAEIRWAQIEVKTKPLTLDEWEATVPPMLDLLRYAGLGVRFQREKGSMLESVVAVCQDERTCSGGYKEAVPGVVKSRCSVPMTDARLHQLSYECSSLLSRNGGGQV